MKRTEIRVFLIDWNEIETLPKSLNLSDEDFMDEAERQGNVFSLEGFQKYFNSNAIYLQSTDWSIRILHVEIE